MDLASCDASAVVCDDAPEPPLDWASVVVEGLVGLALLVALVLVVRALTRRWRRTGPSARRVHVTADGRVEQVDQLGC